MIDIHSYLYGVGAALAIIAVVAVLAGGGNAFVHYPEN